MIESDLADHQFKLLLSFLDEYANVNCVCDDWAFPEDWTQDQVDEFVGNFTFANRPSDPKGDGQDYWRWAKARNMPRFCAVDVIKYLLVQSSDLSIPLTTKPV